ncbi:hypothetical protein HYZ97_05135 [Candidatus Pacearchaeota archaeon]|nr:hypothetical protein [Candidatus Pacearchaeota archaeon]
MKGVVYSLGLSLVLTIGCSSPDSILQREYSPKKTLNALNTDTNSLAQEVYHAVVHKGNEAEYVQEGAEKVICITRHIKDSIYVVTARKSEEGNELELILIRNEYEGLRFSDSSADGKLERTAVLSVDLAKDKNGDIRIDYHVESVSKNPLHEEYQECLKHILEELKREEKEDISDDAHILTLRNPSGFNQGLKSVILTSLNVTY